MGPVAALQARGLEHRWRSGHGVGPLDLEVVPAEAVGILGPNGAGKSTLLRVLSGVLPARRGSLRVLGADTVPFSRLGCAADAPVHFDELTGRENALFFARATGLGTGAARDAVDRFIRRLRLEDAADRPAGEYSLGMRRKLALVEAFAHGPALVLLDEPTLGLDAASQEALLGVIREHVVAKGAVVAATNDLAAAARFDRVVFLHEGRIVLAGRPADLLGRHGGHATIRARIRSARPPVIAIDGADVTETTAHRVELRAARAAAVLPALCATLAEQGVVVEEIRVREPDLRDVFREATGATWEFREEDRP
jgi:ABC-2 type transport system ATP-binding protein